MAYVRGAKRHPMFAITITPEEEALIETELAPYRQAGPLQPRLRPRGRPRQPCGTIQAYWSHRKRRGAGVRPVSGRRRRGQG